MEQIKIKKVTWEDLEDLYKMEQVPLSRDERRRLKAFLKQYNKDI